VACARVQRVVIPLVKHPLALRSSWPYLLVAVALLIFSGGWLFGDLLLDGPGNSIYVRWALEHLRHDQSIPYWMPEMWLGFPVWALAPPLATFTLVPVAQFLGADRAVQLASLAAQIVGGWGALRLARDLWGPGAAATAAGLFFALSPLMITTVTLGAEPSSWVIASAPWLVLALRRAFRTRATGPVIASGLVAGFAVAFQAEHAYGLLALAACVTLVELARAHRGENQGIGVACIVRRATAVVLIAAGVLAHWVLPFWSLSSSFLLTPSALVRQTLDRGLGAQLGQRPGAFLLRSSGPRHANFGTDFVGEGWFYVGVVLTAVTVVTVSLLPRHDRDGTLTAVLVASLLCIWTSTGSVALAQGSLGRGRTMLAIAVIGAVAGVLGATFIGHLLRGTRLYPAAMLGLVVLLFVIPYLRPFQLMQEFLPFADSLRFPRLYPFAVLGLALGAAFPVAILQARLNHSFEWRDQRIVWAATAALVLVFLVDVLPYRHTYRLRRETAPAAFDELYQALRDLPDDRRASTLDFGDPHAVAQLLSFGHSASVGWPHPLASRQAWRITGEANFWPAGYRWQAHALTATALSSADVRDPKERYRLLRTTVTRNPLEGQPVRAYDHVVSVEGHEVAAELATSLSLRQIGTLRAPYEANPDGISRVAEVGPDACKGKTLGPVGGEVAGACSKHRWLGALEGLSFQGGAETTVGATFEGGPEPLRAVSVWTATASDRYRLDLHELSADGRTVGPLLATAQQVPTGPEEAGLARFAFSPPLDVRSKQLVWLLTCPGCVNPPAPLVVASDAARGEGNLVVNDQLNRRRVAAFSLDYGGLPALPPSATTLTVTRRDPGRVTIRTSGARSSLVVLAEARFPGWEARVDGRPRPVVEADSALVGVIVPAGSHTVELRYRRPAAADIGLVLSLGTIVICAALLWRERTSPARRPPVMGARPGRAGPRRDERSQPIARPRSPLPG
jgi:hypothetical protein